MDIAVEDTAMDIAVGDTAMDIAVHDIASRLGRWYEHGLKPQWLICLELW